VSIADLLAEMWREEERSAQLLHMVPSENVLSPSARLAYKGALQSRYSFGATAFNAAWPAMEWFESLERGVEEELAVLLGAEYLSARPLSGMNAMTVALGASSPSSVVTVAVSDGGHAVTSQMAQRLGATVHHLQLLPEGSGIDVTAALRLVERLPTPILIYVDQYCTVRPLRIDGLSAHLPPETAIHYDASHILGLVAGAALPNPLKDGASSLGGSLHKSFPGPHRGLLATNDPTVYAGLREEASRWISHHNPGHTLALAITLAEMRGLWPEYAAGVLHNARTFADTLAEHGVPVFGSQFGYTECHQVFVDVAELLAPDEAAFRLIESGVRANAIDIPQLGRVGLRFGLQELTRRGLTESGARAIAEIVKEALVDQVDPCKLRRRSLAIVETLSWDSLSARRIENP
jgi:glycine hydroxymethyltransferase